MPGFTLTSRANAPVEEVWKLLFDPTRFPEWWAGVHTVHRDDAGGYTMWPDGYPDFPMPQQLRTDQASGRVTISCQVSDIDFAWRLSETGTGTGIEVRVDLPEAESHRLHGQRELIGDSMAKLAALAESANGNPPHAARPPKGPAMTDRGKASVETLEAITAAFNAHDLDAIMEFFTDDCSLDMPRGPEPWGQRLAGKAAVRAGLAGRFAGLPDVHYGDGRHWVSGDLGVSEWLLTGTRGDGEQVRVRGCDHWEFRGGQVVRKDSYWKIVEPAT